MSSKIVLCDIEGTTTSISFVKDNLFPYAAKNVETFLAAHWDAESTKEAVKMLRDQAAADKRDNVDGCVEIAEDEDADREKQIASIAANVKWQIEHDRKATPLKNLQGLMWVEAYKAGAFKGQVYEDVAVAFEAWTKAGQKIYIYSSGSAAIQKVHFEHSEAGDLAKYLSGYFDTKVGAKQEKGSYEAIWKEISKEGGDLNVKDVLFLTDIPAEAKAAREAGMDVMLVKRPGNGELTEEDKKTYRVIESFAEIKAETVVAEEKMEEGEKETVAPKRKIEDVQQSDVTTPPAKVAKIEEPTTTSTVVSETTESKTEVAAAPVEAAKDVPMTVVDEVATEAKEVEKEKKSAAVKEDENVVESTATETKKTEAKEEVKEVTEKNEKKADEETMEVDSTTTTTTTTTPTIVVTDSTAADAPKETEKVTEAEAKKVELDSKDTSAEAEKKTVSGEEEKKESPSVTEEKEAVPEKVLEKEKVTKEVVEEKKENGTEASSTEGEKDSTSAAVVTNGEAVAAAQNGNGKAEAADAEKEEKEKETNGHDDSDKENDKSLEVKPSDEIVSTTSENEVVAPAVASSDAEAIAAAKKCAAIDPVVATAPAAQATPIPAEVQAES